MLYEIDRIPSTIILYHRSILCLWRFLIRRGGSSNSVSANVGLCVRQAAEHHRNWWCASVKNVWKRRRRWVRMKTGRNKRQLVLFWVGSGFSSICNDNNYVWHQHIPLLLAILIATRFHFNKFCNKGKGVGFYDGAVLVRRQSIMTGTKHPMTHAMVA